MEAGADGVFFATQAASAETTSREDCERFDLLPSRRVLERLAGRSRLTMLHVHGRDIYWDAAAALPADALNWHDRVTRPTLAEARASVRGAMAGGLAEWDTLRKGPAERVAGEVADAIAQAGGTGLIVTPGCVLPLDAPDAHLDAVVAAAKGGAR